LNIYFAGALNLVESNFYNHVDYKLL
jgi:hypothetical protein